MRIVCLLHTHNTHKLSVLRSFKKSQDFFAKSKRENSENLFLLAPQFHLSLKPSSSSSSRSNHNCNRRLLIKWENPSTSHTHRDRHKRALSLKLCGTLLAHCYCCCCCCCSPNTCLLFKLVAKFKRLLRKQEVAAKQCKRTSSKRTSEHYYYHFWRHSTWLLCAHTHFKRRSTFACFRVALAKN